MAVRKTEADSKDIVVSSSISNNMPVVQHSTSLSIETLISQAIDKGLDVATMERLLAMAERLDAKHAKEAFDSAMAAFQAQCPIIAKTKHGYNYMYAPIESIVAEVKALLQHHGFSYAVQTVTEGKTVTATCIAKHSQGHSESSSFTVPIDMRDNKATSETQRVAAALTFAKRYAFCNAFGILTGDADTDSVVVQPVRITPAQMARLHELLSLAHISEDTMLKSCGVEVITDMTSAQAATILTRLEARYGKE